MLITVRPSEQYRPVAGVKTRIGRLTQPVQLLQVTDSDLSHRTVPVIYSVSLLEPNVGVNCSIDHAEGTN